MIINSVDTVTPFGDSLINVAATRGIVEEAKLLVENGADVNFKGEHGYTPLHCAVEQGHKEMVEYLLKNGADPYIKNRENLSPGDLAKLLGKFEILSAYLKHYKIIKATSEKDLAEILDYVHDQVFLLSSIEFYDKEGVVTIPMDVFDFEKTKIKNRYIFRTWKNLKREANLVIKNVINFKISDEANVDQGCISLIKFKEGIIEIISSLPVIISLNVSNLEIELIIKEKIKGERIGFSFK